MSNKEQSSIEWLQEQLECFGNKHELQMSWATVDELIEQAKAMHKEEMCQFISDYIDDGQDMTAEEYYDQIHRGCK